ncbi:jg21938 [Pararge aegeria aegeria]|uniref:Jg21938 protein n=1 Tax=Pararge aegeria aegeria TaxID=348720 RepID=A0A8S4SMW4_9NEOP|nr:jg21938 [Pararge aegeria aegeria]
MRSNSIVRYESRAYKCREIKNSGDISESIVNQYGEGIETSVWRWRRAGGGCELGARARAARGAGRGAASRCSTPPPPAARIDPARDSSACRSGPRHHRALIAPARRARAPAPA